MIRAAAVFDGSEESLPSPVASTVDDLRFEVKFAGPSTQIHSINEWLASHPDGVRSAYPPRRVNNIYFDTHDMRCYREVGDAERSKLRWRWYGKTIRPNKSVLEVKRRKNRLGWKLRFDVGPADFSALSWRHLIRGLRRELSPESKLWLDAHPVPILINQYEREYFESADGRVRLTIDREQRVYGQNTSGRPGFRFRARIPESMVVEVKFAKSDERLGGRFIQGIPIRASRNSKYAIGVGALRP